MPESERMLRLAARLAHGRAIDWDREERAAGSEEERMAIQKLRVVAAMSVVSKALMSSSAPSADLSASISEARVLTGQSAGRPLFDSPKAAASAPALAAGSRWGHLEIEERVGAGAFGEVYRARDPRLDREVALKILGPDAADPRAEVVREARLLARIRHPNVVTVHGADRIDGQVGIWTEFLRGQTLDRLLGERGVLDGREAALIGIDLCRALSAVHAAGIVHQDVKLSNVMRAEGGRIVLMDFGLGREWPPSERRRGSRRTLSGTPLFMAPEALGGGPPDVRSDLYSLGVVLFALVTGALPVEASTIDELRAKHAAGERRHARDLRPDLSESFVQLLERALASDPGRRFQTAGDAEHALLSSIGAPAGEREAILESPPPDAVPHRLPAEVDAFVGREPELAALADQFHAGARLVTLMGTGGIGKTRLAVRYGWQSRDQWPGGVWFCDLTEAKTKDGIASAVGEALGVPLGAGDPVEQLGHAIASRGRCLLVLDNFEQVVEQAGATVAPWLARADAVRIVVTSRERLKLAEEEVLGIEPLPLEQGVELFLERARRQRSIAPGGPEVATVREVVRLLEGIPLAIELSAARLRVMTPAQMVERIAQRFRMVAGTGTGRHATLRAAIDGSWELLQPWEKAALAQCAVFEGGFGLEAAEAVLDLSAWPEAPWMVDVLQSLVDQSLLRSWVLGQGAAGEAGRPVMRFGMLISLQEYAREKLRQNVDIGSNGPAADDAEERHARWYARLGEDAAIDALDREHGVERRRALMPELENLLLACRRMAARGAGETAVLAYRAAWAVLELRGPLAVAVELGNQLLAAPLARADRARLLHALGLAKQRLGRIEEARADFAAALAIDRELGDRQSEGRSSARLATIALNAGRMEDARRELEAALVIHREVGDRRAEGVALGNLGLASHEQGRLEEASVQLEAALAIHREMGNRRSEGIVRGNLANLRREQGRIEEARAFFQDALAIHREVGNRRFEGIAVGNLGSLCREQGWMVEAGTHFEAALAIHREVGARRFEGQALDNVASVAFAQGRIDEAHTQFEASLAIHREMENRRAEGIVLGNLGQLYLTAGQLEAAREQLAKAERLLRTEAYRIEVGKVLCTRAELERRMGDARAGDATLAEVAAIVAEEGVRPDSELGRRLASARQALAGGTGADEP